MLKPTDTFVTVKEKTEDLNLIYYLYGTAESFFQDCLEILK